MAIQGSCLCGAVRFEVTGPLTAMLNCHCSRCRKQHGAPFATYGTTAIGDLHWLAGEENVVTYTAEGAGPRSYCKHCGSPVPITAPPMGVAYIPVGLTEGELGMKPQGHMFVGSKASWHEITDSLPQHEKYPAEFGDIPTLPDRPPVQVAPGKIAGSCLCDEVAWEFSNPIAMYQCHCSRCRRGRGAAHGANVFCKLENFQWTRGEELVIEYKPPDASRFAVAFCSKCGGSVPRVAKAGGVAVIPASALDTDPGIRPVANIFVASKATWFEITDKYPQYPEGPPGSAPTPANTAKPA